MEYKNVPHYICRTSSTVLCWIPFVVTNHVISSEVDSIGVDSKKIMLQHGFL